MLNWVEYIDIGLLWLRASFEIGSEKLSSNTCPTLN